MALKFVAEGLFACICRLREIFVWYTYIRYLCDESPDFDISDLVRVPILFTIPDLEFLDVPEIDLP